MYAENGTEIYTVCEVWESRYVIVLLCMKRMPASRMETAGITRMAAKKLSSCLQKRVSARVLYRQEGGILSDMQQAAELLNALEEAVPYGIFAGDKREVEISDRKSPDGYGRIHGIMRRQNVCITGLCPKSRMRYKPDFLKSRRRWRKPVLSVRLLL